MPIRDSVSSDSPPFETIGNSPDNSGSKASLGEMSEGSFYKGIEITLFDFKDQKLSQKLKGNVERSYFVRFGDISDNDGNNVSEICGGESLKISTPEIKSSIQSAEKLRNDLSKLSEIVDMVIVEQNSNKQAKPNISVKVTIKGEIETIITKKSTEGFVSVDLLNGVTFGSPFDLNNVDYGIGNGNLGINLEVKVEGCMAYKQTKSVLLDKW